MTAFNFDIGPVVTAAAPQYNAFQQPAAGGGAQAAAAPNRPLHRKFKDVDVLEAGKVARQHLLESLRNGSKDKALNKAVVKCDIVATVVGSATAAPTKGAPLAAGYIAAASASDAAKAVHAAAAASPNLQTAQDINALILSMADLDFANSSDE